jgi:hypothetical protein
MKSFLKLMLLILTFYILYNIITYGMASFITNELRPHLWRDAAKVIFIFCGPVLGLWFSVAFFNAIKEEAYKHL